IIRENWGKVYSTLPKLDLLAIQKQSYKWFLEEAIGNLLKEISPVEDFTEKNWSLFLKNYRIGNPSITPDIAISKGITYNAPLYVQTSLINKKTNEAQEQEIFLGDI